MKKPKVSVVIPTYNREKTLPRAVESVINQTYTNWELIIVDDASKDNTEKLVKKYLSEKIKYFKNPENKQKSYSRNYGIKQARGEFIAFLDSDDEWLPEKLEEQINVVGDEYDGCFTGAYKFEIDKKVARTPKIQDSLMIDVLKNNISISIGSTGFVRKTLLDKVGGFREDMTVNEDIELVVKLAGIGEFVVLDKPLINIYDIDKPRDASRVLEAKEKVLKYRKEQIEELPSIIQKTIYARQYISVARAYAVEGNFEKSMKYVKKSLSYRFLFSERFKVLPVETYVMIPVFFLRRWLTGRPF